MVTPMSLNGAGCAAAPPAASVDANNNAANTLVFTEASLLSSILFVDWRCNVEATSLRARAKAQPGGIFRATHQPAAGIQTRQPLAPAHFQDNGIRFSSARRDHFFGPKYFWNSFGSGGGSSFWIGIR